jgi:hypothetical protein
VWHARWYRKHGIGKQKSYRIKVRPLSCCSPAWLGVKRERERERERGRERERERESDDSRGGGDRPFSSSPTSPSSVATARAPHHNEVGSWWVVRGEGDLRRSGGRCVVEMGDVDLSMPVAGCVLLVGTTGGGWPDVASASHTTSEPPLSPTIAGSYFRNHGLIPPDGVVLEERGLCKGRGWRGVMW